MRMSTDWSSLMIATGSIREQARRENNGTRHRETTQINAEIAADCPRQYAKRGPSVDTKRANAIINARNERQIHDDIRHRFGPRLVRPDGTALYQCQIKK